MDAVRISRRLGSLQPQFGAHMFIHDRAAAGGVDHEFVGPVAIDEDMLFPPRTCEAHQILIPNSELRVIHSLWGHNGLLGADPEYVKQIEGNLSELLAAST